jgi:molybdenum cofactor cytidylyltransferase
MNLARALRVTRSSRVAFAGAGGKTTALFQLARALEPPVVVTSSTHLGTWQASLADHHVLVSRPEDIERFAGQVEGVTLFSGEPGGDERLQGLGLETLSALQEMADRLGFPVLLEADGSRRKPLKAPGDQEPVIPGWVNLVVVVAGLSGLGQPLADSVVHRPEQFAELSGMAVGETITPERIARLLVHPLGGLKDIPRNARKAVLLNQADDPAAIDAGFRIATSVRSAFDAVLISSLNEKQVWRVVEPTAGIILAGGESSRFGQPKMLLEWQGKPLIYHVAKAALAADLNPVVVVTGAVDQPIRQALEGLPVVFTQNPDWKLGQSRSIKAGLGALPENTTGAVFLLADQPLVKPALLRALVERHSSTLAPVTAPRHAGQRANPVLFDYETFPRLLQLEGDTGGRAIIDQYPVDFVDWEDPNLLFDIDTPDDYARLQEMA